MPTVLVVDDSEQQRREICDVLKQSGVADKVLEACDGIEGLKMLTSNSVDAVLCDLEMPGLDGEKLLRFRNCDARASAAPFLFLTASRDLERKTRLLDGGASDAILKPFHPAELVARLRLHLRIKQLQDELVEKNERLTELSTVDALTGLRNRRYFEEALATEWSRSTRHRSGLALVMVDIDHFKRVNDGFGHPAGDAVLKQVAELVASRSRQSDVVSRIGGEEFAMILAETDADGGAVYADQVRGSLESTELQLPQGGTLRVTLSAGVADSSGRESTEELIAAADTALYRAKEGGRNQVVKASDESA